MKAYLFWYKSDEYAPTEYIYIIAYTLKQARYYYIKLGYTRMFDYSLDPVKEIEQKRFNAKHEIGDILGQYAVI